MKMTTPKGLRLHIGIFGRRNVGKSSILNAIVRQSVSIVSDALGTTTDPVEKPMELLPLGPVVFIDTAGLDDEGALGELRIERTKSIFDRCDLALIVCDGAWGTHEEALAADLQERNVPILIVLNKADVVDYDALPAITLKGAETVRVSALNTEGIDALRLALIKLAPSDYLESSSILGDILTQGAHIMLVVPIDKAAPKGRLILPQVQVIRDILDQRATCTICQEDQIPQTLARFREPPQLIVTDSQVFASVSAQVPEDILLTGFSVLFARFKGDLASLVQGASAIRELKPGDRVLIAESCTHHPVEDDIGREKIPRWLKTYVGGDLEVDVASGQAFPKDLSPYAIIIHCGACMWTRRQMLSRIQQAKAQNVPITNYGLAIACIHGILDRALMPFPAAHKAYLEAQRRQIDHKLDARIIKNPS